MRSTSLIITAAATLLTAPAMAADGPISKFNGMKPVGEYISTATLTDIERCLIDMEGWRAPTVYRQPDRPGVATIIWPDPSGLSAARIDLTAVPRGTRIKSWMPANQARACSPQSIER